MRTRYTRLSIIVTAPTEIYTLSLHDALPIFELTLPEDAPVVGQRAGSVPWPTDSALVAILREGRVLVPSDDDPLEAGDELRSEEHTSELQSLRHLVCRLLLEKKK